MPGATSSARAIGDRLRFVQGNAEALPFPDRSFDAYTIAFGIRNVTHIEAALAEAFRVLKRGGRFLCLEFSDVRTPMLDKRLRRLFLQGDPQARRTGRERRRLPINISSRASAASPTRRRFAGMIGEAGFERVQYRNLSGGIAALHSGWRI